MQSYQDDLAEPAATYLAAEGAPAARLLTILGTLTDDDLRERLRIGLARREHVPAGDVAALLRSDNPVARADAAWVCGIGPSGSTRRSASSWGAPSSTASGASGAGSRPWLAGDTERADSEVAAWVMALWAGRRGGAGTHRGGGHRGRADGRRARRGAGPGAHALPDAPSAVEAALRAPSIEVRYAAASAMPRVVLQADLKPRDPAVVARAVLGQGCPRAPSALAAHGGAAEALRPARQGHPRAGHAGAARGAGSRQGLRAGAPRRRRGAVAVGGARDPEVLGELAFAEGESEAICKAAFRARRRVARAMEARA
ncbi:MAG: hypothetical protein R3F59_21070 [Myxococcota bacterium]